MRTGWKGFYYDGKTAERHEASVLLTSEGLTITVKDSRIQWAYDTAVQTQGFFANEPVRLERGDEALVVSENGFIEEIKAAAPGFSKNFQTPQRLRRGLIWVPLAIAFIFGAAIGAYFWLIPGAANFAAERLDPELEEKIGAAFVNGLKDALPECKPGKASASVDEILKKLDSAAQGHPYRFKVHLIKSDMVNALAAPGGHIVIFSGLLEMAGSPEELAGVMSHEMQHILKKHSTKGMFHDLSGKALLAIVLGDFHGISGMMHTFGSMKHSREFEEEADRLGADLMIKANIGPEGMIKFFERLAGKNGSETPKPLRYLSTHPLTRDRIDYITKHATGKRFVPIPLLAGADWDEIKKSCE